MFCEKCGTYNEDHSNYCINDGNELDEKNINIKTSKLLSKYCDNCGFSIDKSSLYCSECGESTFIIDEEIGVVKEKNKIKIIKNIATNKFSNNTLLKILVGAVSLVLLAFISISIFKSSFNDEKLLENLYKAVETNDTNYFKKHIEVQGFSDLEDKDITKVTELLSSIDIRNTYVAGVDEVPEHTIYISKKGKEKIIYDKFIINIKPVNLNLISNVKGAEVYLDGESIGKTNESYELKHESLIPGNYDLKLSYNGKYAKDEARDKIYLYNGNSDNIDISLDLNLKYIKISSNRDDTKLYVNDKDTGILVNDIGDFGPVILDGSISIQGRVETDGGVLESTAYTISSGMIYHLDVADQEVDIRNELDTLIYNYEVGLVDAINHNDFSYASPYIVKGSSLYKLQKKLMKNLYKEGVTEEFLSHKIKEIEKIDDNNYSLIVDESHMVYNADGSQERVNNTWKYTVKKVGYEFLLNSLSKI